MKIYNERQGFLKVCHVDVEDLPKINVSRKQRMHSRSTSRWGSQVKWCKGNLFIKLDTNLCYQGLSEVFVTCLLKFSNVEEYVEYKRCRVYEDGEYLGTGCYSKRFLKEGERDISFYTILKTYGYNIQLMGYNEVRDVISNIVGFDVKGYIDRCLCIDAITYNEDRHLNNLSVIKYSNGTYRAAPIYDNGSSCLSDVFRYPMIDLLINNLMSVQALPFNTSFIRQLSDNHSTPILIDKGGFINSVQVETREEIRAFNVIKEGLNRTEGLAWEDIKELKASI